MAKRFISASQRINYYLGELCFLFPTGLKTNITLNK